MRGLHFCAITALLFWTWPYSEVNLLNLNGTDTQKKYMFWMFQQQLVLSFPLQVRKNMAEKYHFQDEKKGRKHIVWWTPCHCRKWASYSMSRFCCVVICHIPISYLPCHLLLLKHIFSPHTLSSHLLWRGQHTECISEPSYSMSSNSVVLF